MTVATPRFLDALGYAVRLHGADLRKGTKVPYVAHLFGVCALVLGDGGSEDEAVAALLHDALEDHPAETTREEIARRFGEKVRKVVEGCTDTPSDYKGGAKPPWRERKEAYLLHLAGADPMVRRVALADKLDNVRSMIADYCEQRERLWSKFNAGKEDQLWLLRSLAGAFREAGSTGRLIEEFERSVAELERVAGAGG